MKVAVLQLWEIIFSDNSIQSDGCSLHLCEDSRNEFIKDYSGIVGERPVGLSQKVEIVDSIYKSLTENLNIRLTEVEFNNLMGLKNIEVSYDI